MENIDLRIRNDNTLSIKIDLDESVGTTAAGNEKIATTRQFERIGDSDYVMMLMVLKSPKKNKGRDNEAKKADNKTSARVKKEVAPKAKDNNKNKRTAIVEDEEVAPKAKDNNKNKRTAIVEDEEVAPKAKDNNNKNKRTASNRPTRHRVIDDLSDI